MAQIQFFANESDEMKLLDYLSKDSSIKFNVVINEKLTSWVSATEYVLPEYSIPLQLCIYKENLGELNWFDKEPSVDESMNSKLVKSIFTKQFWHKQKETDFAGQVMDDQNSPVVLYSRGERVNGYNLSSQLLSPQTSVDYLGNDFKKWFNRILSWITRNGEVVFSPEFSIDNFKNDDQYLNSVYALPEAKKLIDLKQHDFAISVRRQPLLPNNQLTNND